jgi:hypothetical protein
VVEEVMELDVTAEDTQRAYERYTYDMSKVMYGAYHARYEYAARLACERRIAQLEARLLALEWKPITKASIVLLGHEVLRKGCAISISPLLAAPSSSALLKEGYTHYRLINAPKVEVVQ